MASNTISILKPSVNNLTVRIFVRAAGLDFEEIDVWGKKGTDEFLAKDPADLTPLLEEEGLPRGSLWESCAIMQYLCNKHGLHAFYPTDPEERAMVDSAMFYLIGTFYPLLARATYPTLGFAQYAGEAATADVDDATKTKAAKDAEAANELVAIINQLGADSGHSELQYAPIAQVGHSAGSPFAWGRTVYSSGALAGRVLRPG